ncbi:hypothetical protein ACMFMG_009684 [Clarireedia jacksonii]
MSQSKISIPTRTPGKVFNSAHMTDSGNRKRTRLVLGGSSDDELPSIEVLIPCKGRNLKNDLKSKGKMGTSKIEGVCTVKDMGFENIVQVQVREAENSLDSLRKLVNDYEQASKTHVQELETANKRVTELETIRDMQAREIDISDGIIAEQERKISSLYDKILYWWEKSEAERNHTKKVKMDAEEKCKEYVELKEVMRKALGLDNQSDMA